MSHWTLIPHIVVRTTGFPWEILEGLRHEDSVLAALRVDATRRVRDGFRDVSPRIRKPTPAMLSALRAGRPIADLTTLDHPSLSDWNMVAEAAQRAEGEFDVAFEQEAARTAHALRETGRDPRFLEAVAISCPPVYLNIVRREWSNRLERQVASFVQRFCSKNETVSFFGPINYGRLEPDAPTGVSIEWSGPAMIRARRTHVAHWVVRGLVAACAADAGVVAWIVPRRRLERRHSRPDEPVSRLLAVCDGVKPCRVLAKELGIDLAEIGNTLRLAHERRLITHQLDVPPANDDPLLDLTERLAGLPGDSPRRLVREIAELRGMMEEFSWADAGRKVALNASVEAHLMERFEIGRHSGGPARRPDENRGEGHHFYVDRLPLREECGGDLRLTISGERARELETRMQGTLDALASAAVRTQAAARAALAQRMGKQTLPFWRVIAQFADGPIPYDRQLHDAVAAQVADPGEEEVHIDSSTLPMTPLDGHSLVSSIDLLLEARGVEAWSRGDYKIIAGDVHDTALVWGWALQFHEQRKKVDASVIAALGRMERRVPVVTALASRRTGLIPAELPGPVIELGGVSNRAGRWQLPFEDLIVESDGETSWLKSQSLDTEVLLYNGELESSVHTAFAIPRVRPIRIDLGPRTPRIWIDKVMIQRRTWRLSDEHVARIVDCRDDRERFRVGIRIWEELGLPLLTFGKLPGERKPVLVDPSSPVIFRVFANLLKLRKAAVLGEMRPAPDGLWLQGNLGRHTAELRCTYVRTPAA